VIDINLNGILYGMRYQIPAMLDAGAGKCAIVNMASIHGMVAAIGNGAYTAAKHGVVGLTKNAAAEYGPEGLRINCVGPAYIETPLLADLPPGFKEQLIAHHPLGRGTMEFKGHKVPLLMDVCCMGEREGARRLLARGVVIPREGVVTCGPRDGGREYGGPERVDFVVHSEWIETSDPVPAA
jgi:NAD(P)-dependent dehydrogenase (short-subunit alcohol dehydrogenase family)